MSEFSDFLENALLNHVFRNVAYSPPAGVFLALHTTASSDAAPGTEVTGSGYARKPVTFGAPSSGQVANTGVVSFTPVGGNYGTVVGTSLFDAVSGGNQLCFDNDFVDTPVNNGEVLEFAVGDIVATIS